MLRCNEPPSPAPRCIHSFLLAITLFQLVTRGKVRGEIWEVLASLPAPDGPITGSGIDGVWWRKHELCSQTDLDPASDTHYLCGLGQIT